MPLQIRRPTDTDRESWNELYAGYADFYQVTQTQDMRDKVWSWITDPAHEVDGLVADLNGAVIGLTHFRPFARPLAAATGGFLDDLFVDPAARGSGAARALIEAVSAEGKARGWSVIRWITADNNYRARGLYDQLADRTGWITYDIKI
ncbi:GNAT family N-acetyltransferase [Marivivens marinus]|uniref:GNAT family N-acetyltransferase n=1 Tax=Marivivens marinus TaxID=3110173 RepID=UPI003B845E59